METRDKCKVTNFIINLNIQHEQLSNKSSSLIKQSILSLLRTLIFQILSEKKVKKVIFSSRTSIPSYIAIAKKVMTYWASRLCHSCVHNSESLWLSQNLLVGMCCLSFLCKPRNWYGNCFISRPSPDMELTCYLLLQHTNHLCFHFLPTTSCMSLEFIFIMNFLPQTLISTTLFLMFVQGHLQWNFWY